MKEIYRIQDLERGGYGSRATIWRKVKVGEFPAPRNFNGRPGWDSETIHKWKKSRPTVGEQPAESEEIASHLAKEYDSPH